MKYHLTALALDMERKLFWAIITLCAACMIAYVYFICASVVNIVLRKEAAVQIAAINSHIGNLEGTYLQKKNALTEQYALEHGFIGVAEKTFALKTTSDGKGLSLLTQQ